MSSQETTFAEIHLCSDELSAGPWIFARQIDERGEPPQNGAVVEVFDASGRFVGHGLFNLASDIRVRLLSRGRRKALARPREFLLARIKSADRIRRRLLRLEEVSNAYRVVHAEGDDLPGLIVDRLGRYLVCEHHALGFWQLREEVEWALRQLYPKLEVVHRVPRPAARAEDFDPAVMEELEARELPETEIVEHRLRYPVRPGFGHKTGWFCDQRENRALVGGLAAGREVWDICCNAGGFSLHAKRAGAHRVVGVDLDEVVLERAEAGARLNDLEVEFHHVDGFNYLRGAREAGQQADVVVLDPHKLVPGKRELENGLRKYSDFNTLALECVRPGGVLATFSCSGAVSEPAFIGMLFASARRARREVRLLAQVGAGPDHPQRPEFNRSRYLKGALLAVD